MAERCITADKILNSLQKGDRRIYSNYHETIVVINEGAMERFINTKKPKIQQDEFGTYQEPSSLDDTQEIVLLEEIDFQNY